MAKKQNSSKQEQPDVSVRKRPSYQPGVLQRFRWLIWLIIMVPVIYVAIQVFIILIPRMNYSRAILDTMSDTMPLEGFVVLESIPVYKTPESMGGVLYYSVPTGQRVSANGPVIEVYPNVEAAEARAALQRVNAEIDALENAQRTVETGDRNAYLAQMQKSVYHYLDVIDTYNYKDLQTPIGEVTLAANKLQIVSQEVENFNERLDWLIGQKTRLEQIAIPQESIISPDTGYFVASSGFDSVPPDYNQLKDMPPYEMQQALLQDPVLYGPDVIGHIVSDYKWHFFAVVPLKDAVKFVPGDKSLKISFPNLSEEAMPVRVQSVDLDEVNGLAKVEILCERISPDLLQLNNEKVEIVFRTEKGIRVDKDALHINKEGVKGVFVRFGNMAVFKPIRILMEDEKYLLVSNEIEKGINELALFDEIIVDSGEVELFDGKYL